MRVEDAIDTVLDAPLREFVAVRNRVAGELKKSGDAAAAARVRALRRPPASVWAVNQLARRESDAVEELLEAGARLVKEQARAIAGDGSGFLEQARAERQQAAALARRAEAILSEAGQRVQSATARRIAQTLHAAAVGDAATREALRAGRLTSDLEPPHAFGATTSLPATHARAGAAARHPPAADGHAHARVRAQTAAARKRARAAAAVEKKRAHAEAAAARRRHATLARAAREAEHAAAAQRRAVDKARAEVERAEERLRAAKDALARAELAAQAARRAADESE